MDNNSTSENLHSNAWRLQGVFLEPSRTFEEINLRWNWLLPMLAVIALSFLTTSVLVNSIGQETIIRQQLSQNPRIQELPRERQEEMISDALESSLTQALFYAGPLFSFLPMLIVAGALMLGLLIAGSQSGFGKIFSVTCHVFFAYSVISTALALAVVLLAPDPTEIDIQNPIQSNLAFLFNREESTFLHSFATSIDLLSFYAIGLLALGLSKISARLSFAGGLAIVGGFWLAYVLAKSGLAAAFS